MIYQPTFGFNKTKEKIFSLKTEIDVFSPKIEQFTHKKPLLTLSNNASKAIKQLKSTKFIKFNGILSNDNDSNRQFRVDIQNCDSVPRNSEKLSNNLQFSATSSTKFNIISPSEFISIHSTNNKTHRKSLTTAYQSSSIKVPSNDLFNHTGKYADYMTHVTPSSNNNKRLNDLGMIKNNKFNDYEEINHNEIAKLQQNIKKNN